MSTAEYAVGTIGAACIGCVLIKLGADAGWLSDIFDQLKTIMLRLSLDWTKPWL